VDENNNLQSEEKDEFDPMPSAPRLSDIMEGADTYKAVDIQRDVILQMYETLKGMPPMTQEQHKELIDGCRSFLDTNDQIRNDFIGLLQENKRLQTELTEVKTELADMKKLFAEVTEKMNSLLQEGKIEEATLYAAKVSQLDYITSTSLPERMNDISQRLADNAVSEQAIRTADYKFKDLVAMIYSSRVYEQNELPPEFIMKLEQSIEKLGYVSGEEHEALKLLYDEQTNNIMNMEMELFDATVKIDSLTEINENLTQENQKLNVRVVELTDINENLRMIQQKEMTGLTPKTPEISELDTAKPNRNTLDTLISSIKDKFSKSAPEKEKDDKER
jgi:cell division septum initiation protein DivIVA